MSIRFEHVYKSFGENNVLRDISFEADKSTLYLLTGSSGSGKTTLLRLISGLETPDSGKIHRNKETFSYAFQETRLFPQLSVLENILAIKPRVPAEEILQMLDLTEAAEKYPHELSGGMKKRAGLARALAAAADVYLLDEPTAGQDADHARLVADAIKKYTAGATAIVSTHDTNLISDLNGKIIRIANGRLTVTD